MLPRRSDACGNLSVLSKDNIDTARSTYGVQTWFRAPSSNYATLHVVLQILTSLPFPPWANDGHAPLHQEEISNVEFC